MSNKLPETVIKSNGLPFLPFSIKKPVDCKEKLPLCGFKPACKPLTSVMNTPSPTFSNNSSRDFLPGFNDKNVELIPRLEPPP